MFLSILSEKNLQYWALYLNYPVFATKYRKKLFNVDSLLSTISKTISAYTDMSDFTDTDKVSQDIEFADFIFGHWIQYEYLSDIGYDVLLTCHVPDTHQAQTDIV
jgi:hypothetical protein